MNVDEFLKCFGEYRDHAVLIPWVISICTVTHFIGVVLSATINMLLRVSEWALSLWETVCRFLMRVVTNQATVATVKARAILETIKQKKVKPKNSSGQS